MSDNQKLQDTKNEVEKDSEKLCGVTVRLLSGKVVYIKTAIAFLVSFIIYDVTWRW